MKRVPRTLLSVAAYMLVAFLIVVLALPPGAALASSHMDAPLIILDPAANTTDVYAFVSPDDTLTVALAVYPFEEPGIGPNKYNFDDNVLYEIHVSTGTDMAAGLPTYSYQFKFNTAYKNTATILQSFLGPIENVDDANQNLTQTYTVTKVTHKSAGKSGGASGASSSSSSAKGDVLGKGKVPPNNEGLATPLYNEDNDGTRPAKDGVSDPSKLDHYTAQTIAKLDKGYTAFAGQRDDGFYADVEAIFDLAHIRNPGKDSQAGFNVHTMVLTIPMAEIGGSQQVVGVFATTSRQSVKFTIPKVSSSGKSKTSSGADTLGSPKKSGPIPSGKFVQVGRQGNPLFCEVLVGGADKDLYNRTLPDVDKEIFSKYATTPELSHLINELVFGGSGPAPETGRTDIAGIFIPDLIRVDLSTGPCRLAGSGAGNAANPDDAGFSRLGIFGGDTLVSKVQAGFGNGVVPGGWPNGRRFGDDVIDIALTALVSDLRVSPPVIRPVSDNVTSNDIGYNKVFPYAGTPHNGRNVTH